MRDDESNVGGRFWWYSYSEWQPTRWWNYIIPYRGGDEWGRLTLVQHIPPFGFLVFAFMTCYCEDCESVRVQTRRIEQEARDDPRTDTCSS